MTVKEALKKCMKLKRMTQIEVADAMGTSQSNLAMRLRSDNRMLVDNLVKVADVCGYDVALVDREDRRNAFVIGSNDTLTEAYGDESFDDRIRRIIAEEMGKR